MTEARIIACEERYLVVYKPAGLHSAPLKGGGGGSLLEIIARSRPEVLEVRGRQPWEGGLIHRLDYETEGLTLMARDSAALEAFTAAQERGLFVKGYGALARRSEGRLPGFPPLEPPPDLVPGSACRVESGFRPWGPGRRAVRPLLPGDQRRDAAWDRGGAYLTELTLLERRGPEARFALRIRRGFRHQIRCHLAWLGWPLLNDALYGGEMSGAPAAGIALRAESLSFPDPETGAEREYRLETPPPLAGGSAGLLFLGEIAGAVVL
ncbi:MAG: RNA pseudouridine synthase [Spirochaetaceae bacterium]|nr:RNA pseudouridine synthase [Spirochaetaceae bacterium]